MLPHSREPDKYVLHAPLQRIAAKVGGGVISLLQRINSGQAISAQETPVVEALIKARLVTDAEEDLANIRRSCSQNTNPHYRPTSVTLMPTLNCNLACVYCYSNGGCGSAKLLTIDAAKAAIDFVVKNAIDIGHTSVSLGYHGGGEPLMRGNMPFLKETSTYFRDQAKQHNLKPSVSSATNGTLDRTHLEWVTKNIDRLTVSLDGPEDIQNSQRPLRGPRGTLKPTFQTVVDTIRYLESIEYPYGIRATITKHSVSRMPEILMMFYLLSHSRSFHLEPMFKCGRCKMNGLEAPSSEEFTKYSIETRKLADQLGVDLYFSGCRLDGVTDKFCGAVDSNFFITPEGIVTTCLEECRSDDSSAGNFFIGQYNSQRGAFDVDMDKLGKLRTRTVDRLQECKDCFVKYNCSGYCPKKVQTATGDMFHTGNMDICKTNVRLAQFELERSLESRQGGIISNTVITV